MYLESFCDIDWIVREKIEDNTSEPKYIITKRGIGYYV